MPRTVAASSRLRAAFVCLFASPACVVAIAFWALVLEQGAVSRAEAKTPGCAPLERVIKSFNTNDQFDDVLLLSNAQSVAYFEASYTGVDPAIQVLLVRHVSGRWAALRVFDDEACLPPLPLQPPVHERGMAAVYGDPA